MAFNQFIVWEGKVCEESEVLLTAKTTANQWLAISNFIQENHPYDLPEILAFTPEQCSEQYGAWVSSEGKFLGMKLHSFIARVLTLFILVSTRLFAAPDFLPPEKAFRVEATWLRKIQSNPKSNFCLPKVITSIKSPSNFRWDKRRQS
jgi:hypothetical protein